MQRRQIFSFAGSAAVALVLAALTHLAQAQPAAPFKIGFILPMTGQSASTGKQIEGAIKLWQAQNGSTVAGRKVEVIIKDDATVPDTTRRIDSIRIRVRRPSLKASRRPSPIMT